MLHPPRGRAWFGRDDGRSVRTPMVASQGRREAVSTRVACALDPREYFLKPLVGCRIVHISADVADAVEQSMRDVFFNCADGKVAQSVCQIGAKHLVGPLAACYADDRKGIRQQTFRSKIVECRHEEAVGQVARRAENDEAARVGRCGRGCRALRPHERPPLGSTWPPKPLRMADRTFSANVWSRRERKRAKSAADRTSAGTAWSIAA